MRALMLLMTATVFAPDCLRTATETDGVPSSEAADDGSAPVSTARPTSLILTGYLLRFVTTIWLKPSTDCTRDIVRSETTFAPSCRLPPGSSRFCARRAFTTSVVERL